MSFRKPFKAVPVKLSPAYQRKQQLRQHASALRYLTTAVAVGAMAGLASIGLSENGRSNIAATVKPVGVGLGIIRARSPQAGDVWGGCNDARAAGTAPIYRNEPGYREQMDGDGDGIACEPYR